MAQLKDLLVNGASRLLNTLYVGGTTNLLSQLNVSGKTYLSDTLYLNQGKGTKNIGSTAQGIYVDSSGELKACSAGIDTLSFSGTDLIVSKFDSSSVTVTTPINTGTANHLAYYSATDKISSSTLTLTNITDSNQALSGLSYLTINASHQTDYRFQVDGSSYLNGATVITGATTINQGSSVATSTLTIGNNTNGKGEGAIFLYTSSTGYHGIKTASTTTAGINHILPSTAGWIATGGNGSNTGAGGATKPVYLNTSGVLTECEWDANRILYSGTTGLTAMGAGSSNQILQSNGSSAPSWVDAFSTLSWTGKQLKVKVGSVEKTANIPVSSTGAWWASNSESITYVDGSGYMNVGRFIDFHPTYNASGYNIRLDAGTSTANRVYTFPTDGGEFIVRPTAGTAVGSTTLPVYVDTDGLVKAISNVNVNLVYAGPSSGSTAAAPNFRALVEADIPSLSAGKIGSGTLAVSRGGTNIGSYTIGDILYASASTTLSKLGGNTTTTRKFLRSVATTSGTAVAPAWDTVTATDVGLNNLTNYAQIEKRLGTAKGDMIYYTGSAAPARLAIGTSGQVLTTNSSGIPAWATITTSITISTDTNKLYLLGYTATSGSINTAYARTNVYISATNDYLYADRVYNAVWNDYAEMRQTEFDIRPGNVVIDNDNGIMSKSMHRLHPGAQIVSDTYGSCMGETSLATTPVAVSGRVLAYTYQDRSLYHAGMAVCSAPNGTIDIMTREEISLYPDAIIGIVSEIPDYEYWGSGNVKVDNRIWIKVK